MSALELHDPPIIAVVEITSKESITISKCENLKYEWNISNFDTNFTSLESPIFSNGMNMKYRLKLEKKNYNVSLQNGALGQNFPFNYQPPPQFSLFGSQNPARAEEIKYCVKIMVISSDATKIKSHCKIQLLGTKGKSAFTSYKRFEDILGTYVGCFEMYRHNITSNYVQNNRITLTCEINAVIYISIPQSMPKCTLLDDCELLFENQEFTDFTFYVSDKEFKVHKVILAARSPVFKAMFQHDMEESKNNRVELHGVDSEVFRELLRFVYTGKVRNLNEIAIDLLQVASMYGLENLKMLCVQKLCKNISVENAVKVLILANLHSSDALKAIAIGYIARHVVYVSKTYGWNNMIQSHPELITEILTYASIQLLQAEVL